MDAGQRAAERESVCGLFKRVQVNRANACLSLARIPCGMSGGCLVRERPEYKTPTSMASRLIGTGAGKRLLPPALHAPPYPLVIHRPCHLLPQCSCCTASSRAGTGRFVRAE